MNDNAKFVTRLDLVYDEGVEDPDQIAKDISKKYGVELGEKSLGSGGWPAYDFLSEDEEKIDQLLEDYETGDL